MLKKLFLIIVKNSCVVTFRQLNANLFKTYNNLFKYITAPPNLNSSDYFSCSRTVCVSYFSDLFIGNVNN